METHETCLNKITAFTLVALNSMILVYVMLPYSPFSLFLLLFYVFEAFSLVYNFKKSKGTLSLDLLKKIFIYSFIFPLLLAGSLMLLLHSLYDYHFYGYPEGFFFSFMGFILFSLSFFLSSHILGSPLSESVLNGSKKSLIVFLLPVVLEMILLAVSTYLLLSNSCASMNLFIPAFICVLLGVFFLLTAMYLSGGFKSFGDKRIKLLSILSIMAFLASISSFLAVVLATSGYCHPVDLGWVKFQINYGRVQYLTNGSYRASLVNTFGVPVKVDGLVVKEYSFYGETNCSVESPDSNGSVKVGPGGLLTLEGVCDEKSEEEGFDLLVMFNYTVQLNGKNSTHLETGHIKGQAIS